MRDLRADRILLLALGVPALLAVAQQQWLRQRPPRLVALTPAAASAGFAPERLDAVCRSCIVMLGVAVVFAPAH